MSVMLLLLGILVGLLLGLIIWEFWLVRSPWIEKASLKSLDYAFIWLLVLAILASGMLITYTALVRSF